jgi:hypothetical protein
MKTERIQRLLAQALWLAFALSAALPAAAEPLPEPASESGRPPAAESLTAAFTAPVRHTVTLKKKVTGTQGETDDAFAFTGSCCPDTAAESVALGADSAPLTLRDGEETQFLVADGTPLTLTEADYAAAGYDDPAITAQDSAGNPAGTAQDHTFSTDAVTDDLTVTFSNHRRTASLTVAKRAGTPAVADTAEFSLSVAVAGASGSYPLAEGGTVRFSQGAAVLTLRTGQSATIRGLPAGAAYRVTETPGAWYEAAYQGAAGMLAADGVAVRTAVVTNTYAPGAAPVVVTKRWAGTPPAGLSADSALRFTLLRAAGSGAAAPFAGGTVALTESGGGWTGGGTFARWAPDGSAYAYSIGGELLTIGGVTYEASVPADGQPGSLIAAGVGYTVTADGFTVTNTRVQSAAFALAKIDALTKEPLEGVRFVLSADEAGETPLYTTAPTGADGLAAVPAGLLEAGESFWVREDAASVTAAGYEPDGITAAAAVAADGSVSAPGGAAANPAALLTFADASAKTSLTANIVWDTAGIAPPKGAETVSVGVYGAAGDRWLRADGSWAEQKTAYAAVQAGTAASFSALPQRAGGAAVQWSAAEQDAAGAPIAQGGTLTAAGAVYDVSYNKDEILNVIKTAPVTLRKTVSGGYAPAAGETFSARLTAELAGGRWILPGGGTAKMPANGAAAVLVPLGAAVTATEDTAAAQRPGWQLTAPAAVTVTADGPVTIAFENRYAAADNSSPARPPQRPAPGPHSPQTGDAARPALWGILLAAGAVLAAGLRRAPLSLFGAGCYTRGNPRKRRKNC